MLFFDIHMRFSSLPTAFTISSEIFKLSMISLDGSEQPPEQAKMTFKTTKSRVLEARLAVKKCFAGLQLTTNPGIGSSIGDVSGERTLSDHKGRSKVSIGVSSVDQT